MDKQESSPMRPGITTPVPDPTTLTTSAIMREVEHLKELFNTRLNAMDKAVELLQEVAARSPTINEVYLQHGERLDSIVSRADQAARDSKAAIDAAFQAQKEAASAQNQSNAAAIAKSEGSFTKQIDQIGSTMQALTKAMDDKIDDMKSRLTTIEGRSSVSDPSTAEAVKVIAELRLRESRHEGHSKGLGDGWGYVIGLIGLIVAVLSFMAKH